jgi:hypothetical protein
MDRPLSSRSPAPESLLPVDCRSFHAAKVSYTNLALCTGSHLARGAPTWPEAGPQAMAAAKIHTDMTRTIQTPTDTRYDASPFSRERGQL